ncbi:phosphodiester glycosidase family protein [Streptomyces sp. NBC_01320]|uniref:phosphodiester glycosidase family protein n=1 Tax=Streptomyces sp. NBC_01320 TaxID=2903824 RepID=UPI002E159C49|nr:phosphodiester glycosidase family protein [Streptomyces sp. NBC_01320]
MNGRWSVRVAALALAPLLAGCSARSASDTGSSGRDGDVPTHASSPSAIDPSAQPLPDGVSFTQSVRTLDDGSPVRTSVLTVAQDAAVDVEGVHGASVATTDTVRELARRAGAVAAVNGTFFDSDSVRYKGDPLGLYMSRGTLLSEAAGGRTALILPGPGERPRITELRSATHVTSSDGSRAVVDGTDRVPGRIVGCGGVGGDRLAGTGALTTDPLPGRICEDSDEIVDFPAQWGTATPHAGTGSVEAVLDARSTVTGVRSPAGGVVPDGGRTLVGIGSGADWLRAHARPGRTLTVSSVLTDAHGVRVDVNRASVFGAGPALVRSGRIWINAAMNGVSEGAVRTRSPRTVAGVRADGTLLLVVFDGRRPGVSEGVTLPEAADCLRSLGAVDALNLDGGGSSTMVVRDRVRNSPSDPGRTDDRRQRKVSNAIAVIPRKGR